MKTAAFIVAVVAAAAAATAHAQVRYTLTDMGSLGNFSSLANGISSDGRVVGEANQLPSGYDKAVRFAAGVNPVVLTGEGASGAAAHAVNSSGVVVGFTDSLNLNGFAMDATGVHDLGTVSGGFSSAGCDINDDGLIVGFVQSGGGFQHAVTWRKQGSQYVMTPLPELGGFSSVARGVSRNGLIVGECDLPSNFGKPCLWTDGGTVVHDLQIETSSFGEALGVNDAQEVVGYSYTTTGTVAFYWSQASGELNLGGLGNAHSIARSINNRGEVVGQSYIAGTSAVQHAFVWRRGDAVMTDLNTLVVNRTGWILWDAEDINDQGQIVGGGVLNGQPHAFLLTPVACPADLGGPGGTAAGDGHLDNNDFIAFINLFFQQNAAADLGAAGGVAGSDGRFDNNDFIAFISRFFAGC
ncbi:MAG: GC-type dockerin domain-anchored protein [Phycisphaerales bacterium]